MEVFVDSIHDEVAEYTDDDKEDDTDSELVVEGEQLDADDEIFCDKDTTSGLLAGSCLVGHTERRVCLLPASVHVGVSSLPRLGLCFWRVVGGLAGLADCSQVINLHRLK